MLSYRQLKAGKKIPKAKEKDSTFLDMGNSRYCRKMIPIEMLDILSMMIIDPNRLDNSRCCR